MTQVRKYLICLCACPAFMATAQQPFSIDTTFRTEYNTWYTSSVLPLASGSLIVSGEMKWSGDVFHKTLAKLDHNGIRDPAFYNSSLGGGKLVPFEDGFYVGTAQTVRKILPTGYLDPSFTEMNSDPLFGSLQGGDYHLYPDGRILMTGAHNVRDSVRGFVGLYNLIWFTNTGRLDTTKIHRKSNGVVGEIEPLSNGKFLVHGNCTLYEGEPVGWVFQVHADGSLDTTFRTTVNWGDVDAFLPLADGRSYAGGIFRRSDFPDDTLRLARFLPNGDLDTSFHSPRFTYWGQPNPLGIGPSISSLQFLENGNMLVTGQFQRANGELRRGICVVDTSGGLLNDFADAGVGLYYYQNSPLSSVQGYLPLEGGKAYVWGAYHGYNDGTTNDTLQRFVTRLYGPDFTTRVTEPVAEKERPFKVYPNPTSGLVTFTYDLKEQPKEVAFVVVKDAVGRQIVALPMQNSQGQLVMDTRELAKGMYTVSYIQKGRVIHLDRLLIQ